MTEWQWIALGALCALVYVIGSCVLSGNSVDADERERDDDGQARDVTQPAQLRPHVRGNTAYGEKL